MRYLIVANEIGFIYRHFWGLVSAIRDQGWEVVVACAADNSSPQLLIDEGLSFIRICPTYGIGKPWAELASIRELRRVIRSVRPDILHILSFKNIVIAGALGRTEQVPAMLSSLTGLGTFFVEDTPLYRSLRPFALRAMRFALGHKNSVLAVENSDDCAFFVDKGIVKAERTVVTFGAGVDPDEVMPVSAKEGTPVILCVSRMLRTKGILQLAEAAKLLRERGLSFEVHLVGGADERNPTSLTPDEMKRVQDEPSVKWFGARGDINAFLNRASIFCSPTYGREGIPRSLTEATAAGLPIVTTNVPGCREIVVDGVTGLLVPPHDVQALANALARLVESKELRQSMGAAARAYFEEKFTTASALRAFTRCYELLGMPLVVKATCLRQST